MSVTSATPIVETQTFLPSSTATHLEILKITLSWTNLGPLTTIFTPPAACTSQSPSLTVYSADATDTYVTSLPCEVLQTTTPYLDGITCQPSGSQFSSFVGTNYSSQFSYATYMSPGISCPVGYSTGNVVTLDASNATATSIDAYTLQATGTHVFCCQSGYTYAQSVYGCASAVTTATTTSLCDATCYSGDDDCDSGSFTTTAGLSTCTTTDCTVPTPFSWNPPQQNLSVLAVALPVYMIHQQSDIPTNDGLSTGDKVAIGVVVPVVVIIAGVIGTLIVVKKMKRKRAENPSKGGAPGVEMQTDY